jgi:hypothetical protein
VSVLLRQAHGFEGLGPRVEAPPPDALPVSPPGYVADRLVQGSVAVCAVAASVHGCDKQVSKIAHFDNLHCEVGKNVEQVLPPAADSVVAVKAASMGAWRGRASTSSSISATKASRPRRLKASKARYMSSTFSCDIARAVSRRLRSRRERLAPTAPRLRGLPRELHGTPPV